MTNTDNSTPSPDGRGGATTLGDRVRSLRLGDRPAEAPGARLPWVLCILLLGSTVAFGYQAFRKPSGPAAKGPAEGSAKTADSGDVVLQAKGYIIPAHQIQVSPLIGGRIVKLYIEEGMHVKKGQKLAEIEVVDYKTDHERAEAKLESAKRNLELLKTNLPHEVTKAEQDLAEAKAEQVDFSNRLEVAEDVDRRGAGSLSKQEMISLRAQRDMSAARVRRNEQALSLARLGRLRVTVAEAERNAAQADLEKAKWRLDNCIVRAPIAGTILTKKAEENNLVNPAAYSNGLSASLCDMADLSDLEVDLTIQERDIAQVHVGQKCLVKPSEAFQKDEAFKKKHPKGYEGVVSRLMPTADRAKGAIPVRVKLTVPSDEQGVYLKPDMGVIVSFKK